ncbi:MAG: hypothetical protein QM784_10285 [Polyangiaceae bacterium]
MSALARAVVLPSLFVSGASQSDSGRATSSDLDAGATNVDAGGVDTDAGIEARAFGGAPFGCEGGFMRV